MNIHVEFSQTSDQREIATIRIDKHPELGSSPMVIVTVELVECGYSGSFAMSILSHVRADSFETVFLPEEVKRRVLYQVAYERDISNWEIPGVIDSAGDDCRSDGVCCCEERGGGTW